MPLFQFFFWFINTLLHVIPAVNLVLEEEYNYDLSSFILKYTNLALSCVMFLLNCVNEHPGGVTGRKGYQSLDKPICPERFASPLSTLYFLWSFSLVRLGFKRDLREEDVWVIPQDLTCKEHREPFEILMKEEEKRCHNKSCSKRKPEVTVKYNTFPVKEKFISNKHKYGVTDRENMSDISEGPRAIYSQLLLDETDDDFDKSNTEPKPSLLRILWKHLRGRVLIFTLFRMLTDVCSVTSPVLLQVLVDYLESPTASDRKWQGYGICFLMLLVGQCRAVTLNQNFIRSFRVGIIARSVLISAIYKKALRLDNDAKNSATVGDIVNLMSVDAQRVMEFLIKISFCHTVPFLLFMVMAVIYIQIGPSALVGLACIICIIPFNAWIAYRQKLLMKQNLKYKDDRIRILNEIFNGMKVLKLYAWEKSFQEKVHLVRSLEIGILLKIAIFYAVSGVIWSLSGFLVTLVTFAVYTLSEPGNTISAGTAFMVLAAFNLIKPSLDFMASNISLGAQAYVSICRISRFLLQSELPDDNVTTLSDSEYAVTFENADLAWNTGSPLILKNINVKIPKRSLVAIVGQVTCGKSSLISAILGDMKKTNGSICKQGTTAYVAQQAWIQNATVRDNILFGKSYRERKYKTVLSACELEHDLTILTAGDQTEIGERGINLSGGQKQRVAVARAVYQDCDIYLLDDPLSAVDSHVGKAMFDHVIGPKGILKNKTRIFATHSIHLLPQVDQIIVMHGGEIREMGTYEELLEHDGPFAQFLKEHLTKEQMEGIEEDDAEMEAIKDDIWGRIEMLTSDAATSGDEGRSLRRRSKARKQLESSLSQSVRLERDKLEDKEKNMGKLVTDERLETGRVRPAVHIGYLKAAGILPLSVALTFFWAFQGVNVATNYWLTDWTSDPILYNASTPDGEALELNTHYVQIYALYGLFQLICLTGYYYLFWTSTVTAGRNLHTGMTARLFHAPMSFFDTTPSGRIINRCSRDIEIVDNFLPIIMRDFLNTFGPNIMSILVIIIQTPVFSIVLIPMVCFFVFVLRFYIPTSRQLRRIENITRSPIYSQFSASLSGASTIRAFNAQERFMEDNMYRVDYSVSYFFAASIALRWLSVNLSALSSLIVFAAAFFQVLMPDPNPGTAGLTISFALQTTGALPWMVRQVADFETHIVSVERIKEYSEVEQEASTMIYEKRPTPTWPSTGRIEFNNFQVRYREGLDLVIKGLTLTIEGGQKIGVVGRTGAGKSSLSLSLFRLMEAAGGSLYVDGINIADIGLHDLRSRLTILPQDPVLFSGTLRFNLDPFNKFSEDEIWTALERAHLKDFVVQLPEKLEYNCGEEGSTLSVGARQLVCLARILLRKTKILILDEATAAVDIQTDTLIQNTIRFAFQDCTVIAIAHRLNTVLDYDKVLVLDQGEVKEFDSPNKLLDNPDSVFYSMAVDAKLV